MDSLVKNQTSNLTPEAAYYFNRAILAFLQDIQDFEVPEITREDS